MNREKTELQSPFAALTWQEQQDRWLAWRSRQLDYQPAQTDPSPESARPPMTHPETRQGQTDALPRMRLPNMRIAAPTRHQELDQVISRHRQALKKAAAFQTAPID